MLEIDTVSDSTQKLNHDEKILTYVPVGLVGYVGEVSRRYIFIATKSTVSTKQIIIK